CITQLSPRHAPPRDPSLARRFRGNCAVARSRCREAASHVVVARTTRLPGKRKSQTAYIKIHAAYDGVRGHIYAEFLKSFAWHWQGEKLRGRFRSTGSGGPRKPGRWVVTPAVSAENRDS